MGVASARNTAQLSLATDPRKALLDAVGDLSGFDIFHNQILVAIYVRPEKTSGGIIRPDALLVANSCSRISKPWDEISLYCGGIEHRDVHSAYRPR